MNRLRRSISIIMANTDTRLVIPCWKMDILLVVHIYRWKTYSGFLDFSLCHCHGNRKNFLTCAITSVICHAAAACPRISA